MRVENIISPSGNRTPNQFVIYNGNQVVFQSYESTIVIFDRDKKEILIGEDYNYSRTTGKYRNVFFYNYIYFPELADLKGLESALKTGFCKGYKVKMM